MYRRDFLKILGAGTALAFSGLGGRAVSADPASPAPRYRRLRARIEEAIGSQDVGLDLRWLRPDHETTARLAINEEQLYPTASCFKAFLVLYYFWNVPQSEWKRDEWSPVYRTAVVSDNILTGQVLADTAEYIDLYGNPIEKFNDFLLLTMGLKNGLYSWKWEGNPVARFTDRRFEPNEKRFSRVGGVEHRVDNLTTAADLVNGYLFMLRPPENAPSEAAAAALELLSIPAAKYQSPFERTGLTGYIGKDGILQKDDISTGNVVNDAGLVTVGQQQYVLSFLSTGQSEYRAINTLRTITEAIAAF